MKQMLIAGLMVVMCSMGVASAQGVTYNEKVTSTVAGSSPKDTYSAEVAELAQRLLEVTQDVRTGKQNTFVITIQSQLYSDLVNASSKLKTTAFAADTAINALGTYSQKSFYENVAPQSKAAEDQGKHASWVLRMIVPGST